MQTIGHQSPLNLRALLIFLASIVIIFISFLSLSNFSNFGIAESTYQYTLVGNFKHSSESHASEATVGLECLDKNGSSISYQVVENKQDRMTWLCEDNNEWFAIITTRTTKGKSWWKNEDFSEHITNFKITRKPIDRYIQEDLIEQRAGKISNEKIPAGDLQLMSKYPWIP